MEKEKVIERVRKLMALATSDNEHEAALAASKAQELMLKHNLQMFHIEEKEEEIIKFDFLEKDSSGWRESLVAAICNATMCKVLYQGTIDGGPRQKKYMIFGNPENVEVVHYLYEYLSGVLMKISPRPVASRESNAFRMGAVHTIWRRLQATFTEFQEASDNTRALVHVQNALVEQKINDMFPKIGKSRSGRTSDYDAYLRGREAGKNIALRKGVSNRNSAGQLLLK